MMPIYTYECRHCGESQDRLYPVMSYPKAVKCSQCGRMARMVIVSGHGGRFCDSNINVPWLASALGNLQPDGERPIESRTEYKRYLKEHDIIAAG